MEVENIISSQSGRIVIIDERAWSFLPSLLPPDPEIDQPQELLNLLSQTEKVLGILKGWLMRTHYNYSIENSYIRQAINSLKMKKETITLNQWYFYRCNQKHYKKDFYDKDIIIINNFTKILSKGKEWLKGNLLDLNLLKQWDNILREGKDNLLFLNKDMFKEIFLSFQKETNDRKYLPPPSHLISLQIDNFDSFLKVKSNIPPLLQCAMLYYQLNILKIFGETTEIITELMLNFFLIERGYFDFPVMNFSEFLDKHTEEYKHIITDVIQEGIWEDWFKFFLKGISKQGEEFIKRDKELSQLRKGYEELILQEHAPYIKTLLNHLFYNPFVTIPYASELLNISFHTADKAIRKLKDYGILKPTTAHYYGKTYCAPKILEIYEDSGGK